MAEEHRCEAPEGHRPCVNNCGFFGSPATMDLCSKCYRDIGLKEQQEASTKSTIETALSSASSVSSMLTPSPVVESPLPPPALILPEVAVGATSSASVASGTKLEAVQPIRCATCRKRVGLTGFKCKCGTTFCGTHRYPEKHGCFFDFKKVGREEIARANPVIKAVKLEKI